MRWQDRNSGTEESVVVVAAQREEGIPSDVGAGGNPAVQDCRHPSLAQVATSSAERRDFWLTGEASIGEEIGETHGCGFVCMWWKKRRKKEVRLGREDCWSWVSTKKK